MDRKNILDFKNIAINSYLIFIFMLSSILLYVGCTDKVKEGSPQVKEVEVKEFGCVVSDSNPNNIAKPIEVNFANKIKYLGMSIEKISENKIRISYNWHLIADLGKYKTVFVHFTDTSDGILFQNDHEFCRQHSIDELKGKYIQETYIVPIPKTAIGKDINIKLGLYALESKWPKLKIMSAEKVPVDAKNASAIVEKVKLQ